MDQRLNGGGPYDGGSNGGQSNGTYEVGVAGPSTYRDVRRSSKAEEYGGNDVGGVRERRRDKGLGGNEFGWVGEERDGRVGVEDPCEFERFSGD